MAVEIDIKPGSDANSLSLKSRGVLPVGVLTDDGFDATTTDPATVLLGDAGLGGTAPPVRAAEKDVDEDGDVDLLFFFRMTELVDEGAIDGNSTELTLTAQTTDGMNIVGADAVRIVPGASKGKGKP